MINPIHIVRDFATLIVDGSERKLQEFETDPRLIDPRMEGTLGQAGAKLGVAISNLAIAYWKPIAWER